MNKKARIAVALSLAALMFITAFGMMAFAAPGDTARATITETERENSERPAPQQPKSRPEPQINAPSSETEQKPSLLDRILGKSKSEQTPEQQPSQGAVAAAAVSDCYDGNCDNGIIGRATVARRGVTNRVQRDDGYTRGGMDRAYRGRVTDGSANDRPGIIGDEGRYMHRRGSSVDNSVDRIGRGIDNAARDTGRSIERGARRADRAIDNVFDRDDNVTRSSRTRSTDASGTNYTMWGIIAGLAIAAVVITLLAVLVPSRRRRREATHHNSRHR